MSGASLQHVDLCVDLELEGWLERARRLSGPYKRRWFVLTGDLLYQYKTPTAPKGAWCHFCRHSGLSLVGAVITKGDANSLLIQKDTDKIFLRASSAAERKAWLSAMKHASDRQFDDSSQLSFTESTDQQNSLSQQYTDSVLLALVASNDEFERHSQISKRRATELQEYLECKKGKAVNYQILERKLKLFDLSAKVVMQSSQDLLKMARKHEKTLEASMLATGLGSGADARKVPRRSTGSVLISTAGSAASVRSYGPFSRRNSSFVWSQKTGFVEIFDDKDDKDEESSSQEDQDEFLDAVSTHYCRTENRCTIL
ncbi:OSBP [Branchiostoma lanceolatum]|uniref:OSBP protein n=1 Tax=Branchiostoma lanceolatum TaxID=7740 RepID=A0A8K0EUS4_BRALA|nr:OSBP [Branchiostoma lanceolatum]